jgi:hypothetical protein
MKPAVEGAAAMVRETLAAQEGAAAHAYPSARPIAV